MAASDHWVRSSHQQGVSGPQVSSHAPTVVVKAWCSINRPHRKDGWAFTHQHHRLSSGSSATGVTEQEKLMTRESELKCPDCTSPGRPDNTGGCGACVNYECGSQHMCAAADLGMAPGHHQSRGCKQIVMLRKSLHDLYEMLPRYSCTSSKPDGCPVCIARALLKGEVSTNLFSPCPYCDASWGESCHVDCIEATALDPNANECDENWAVLHECCTELPAVRRELSRFKGYLRGRDEEVERCHTEIESYRRECEVAHRQIARGNPVGAMNTLREMR